MSEDKIGPEVIADPGMFGKNRKENPMWKALAAKALKQLLISASGVAAMLVISFLESGLQHMAPPEGAQAQVVWMLMAAGISGLIAALKRFVLWDPDKAGK